MISERKSGVLLHVTSLPSYGGVGDLGPAAYAFVDFLVAGKQRLWQVLPLNPTGYGDSPYAALSAFAGNPLLISLEHLVDAGLLYQQEIEGLAGHEGLANFTRAKEEKLPLIERAARRFLARSNDTERKRFQSFCAATSTWLTDYARYAVLRRLHAYDCWCNWPKDFARRDPAALARFEQENAEAIEIERVVQFFFDQQWCALKTYANQRDVEIMGDVAIFVSYDSADVWADPLVFDLNEDLSPRKVSGVPPDYFSATGQRWGNPLYRWGYIRGTDFEWWVRRVRRQLQLYDVLRLDHFRGFEACWEIDASEETAINGKWVKCPGDQLFRALQQALGDPLPLVAEDLGLITKEVDDLRLRFDMPGMRVLQFGFADRGAHLHLPQQFVSNMVVYTGTHDNDTTLGWWRNLDEQEQINVQNIVGPILHPHDIVWSLIRAAESSVAALCIVPLQDLLHLGSEARMNTPAGTEGNWSWRYNADALHPDITTQLAAIVDMTDRSPAPPEKEEPLADEYTEDEDQIRRSQACRCPVKRSAP